MRTEIENKIEQLITKLYSQKESVELTRTDKKFGDYATNIALQLAKKVGKNPKEIAEEIKHQLDKLPKDLVSEVSVAGPGFINIKVSNKRLFHQAKLIKTDKLKNKVVVAEYSDPNPFKILHAGHLYTSIVGDSLANILESAGAKVHRVNFGGDVGLHVAKNIWSMLKDLGGEKPENLSKIQAEERSSWLSSNYVNGNNAYENSDDARVEIKDLNKRIYDIVLNKDHDSNLAKIYWTTREWSYTAFDNFYAKVGLSFEKYIPESEVMEIGLQTVKENTPKVYEESDGAVVFKGEEHDLYTNVFINSQGIPTYAAKDVGLIIKKWQDYRADLSLIVTSMEQEMYMKVVLKSVEQFRPDLANATKHFTHGSVKLAGGVKMSSRLGNILGAEDILDMTKKYNKYPDPDSQISLAAVKYALLKHRVGGDLIFDPKESVSLEGNSGPYLQYAHARAKSILAKTSSKIEDNISDDLNDYERALLSKLSELPEVLESCIEELKPHYLCTYLYELAQEFNRFYENNKVIGDAREGVRLTLVQLYADHLSKGLNLLGITAPEKM